MREGVTQGSNYQEAVPMEALKETGYHSLQHSVPVPPAPVTTQTQECHCFLSGIFLFSPYRAELQSHTKTGMNIEREITEAIFAIDPL